MSFFVSHASRRFVSSLAKQRPALHEIFPQKKTVNRLLFELDSRLTFNKLYPAYEKLYSGLDLDKEEPLPEGFTGKDLMIMKKVLEKIRHKTKAINKNLLALESELLDRSAELGDSDAISLLCFDVLNNPKSSTNDDTTHAKKLFKELYQRNHPLTIKLTADLALRNHDDITAEKYYNRFLKEEDDTFLAGEVYGQLGQICFRKPDLLQAEKCFLKAIKLCPIDFSVRSYFLLGQMYINTDVFKARSLIESSATQGFRESFKVLGLLEMNYFRNYPKAQEWFKLGMELFDFECFIGYFDCAMLTNELGLAKNCFESMKKLSDTNVGMQPLFGQFVRHREDDIKNVQDLFSKNVAWKQVSPKDAKGAVSQQNTWNL